MTDWDGTQWVPQASRPIRRRRARTRSDWLATGGMLALPMLLLAIAGATMAARPLSATLVVSPNHATAWSTATGSGCGYAATEVYVDIKKPEAHAFLSVAPDASGCITFTFNTDGPGTYELATRQAGNGKHWRVMATYLLPVE
jgi:hypothetical protein